MRGVSPVLTTHPARFSGRLLPNRKWGDYSGQWVLEQVGFVRMVSDFRTRVRLGRSGVEFNTKGRLAVNIRLLDGSIKTSEAQYDYIMTKVGAAVARLKDTTCTIDVRMTDLNGPKGGVDKQCSIVLTPPGGSTIRVEEQASEYYVAIDAASAAIKKSLSRVLERNKANGAR